MNKYIPCSLDNLKSKARCKYTRYEYNDYNHLLIISFEGKASEYSTFCYMNASIMAGLEAWESSGLILDFQKLEYDWGKNMEYTLSLGNKWDYWSDNETYPIAIVISDLNREGLTSLVSDEMLANPEKWLFESIEKAKRAILHMIENNVGRSEQRYEVEIEPNIMESLLEQSQKIEFLLTT